MVFDTTELMKAVSSIPTRDGQYTRWGSLDYVDEPIVVGITGAFADTDRLDDAIEEVLDQRGAVGRLYMTKNRDWSYESEMRAAVVYARTRGSRPGHPLRSSPMAIQPYRRFESPQRLSCWTTDSTRSCLALRRRRTGLRRRVLSGIG
jgi:hypothetical protein